MSLGYPGIGDVGVGDGPFPCGIGNYNQRGAQPGFNPYLQPGMAANYSLFGSPSDSTYRIDGSNRVMLVADQSGNSASNGLVLNGVSSNYASTPDSAALSITTNIDIRAKAALVSWTAPAADQEFANKVINNGQGGYDFQVSQANAGKLNFRYTHDGTFASLKSAFSTAALTTSAFSTLWVRVTYQSSNGAVMFFTSPDGITWAQLGTTVTLTAATIFDGTDPLYVGYTPGSGANVNGIIYYVDIRNNILNDGTGIVFQADFSLPAKLASTFTESSTNAATVTVNTSGDVGARISGARDLVQLTQAKQPIFSVSGGYHVATFDGSNDYLASAKFPLAQPEMLYIVLSSVAWVSSATITDGNSSANRMSITQFSSTPTLAQFAGTGNVNSNTGLAVGVRGVLSALFSGTASSLQVNLNTAVSSGSNPGTQAANGLLIGQFVGGTNPANITFSEAILRASTDPAGLQSQFASYLITKWGVPTP